MLTGSLPFSAPDAHSIMQMHVEAAVEPPQKRCRELVISDGLEAILLRMLAKHRDDRFPSMQALARELDRELERELIVRGDKVAVPKVTAELMGLRPRPSGVLLVWRGRRVPTWAVAALAVLLIATSVRFGLWFLSRPAKTETPAELAALRGRALAVLKADLQAKDAALRAAALVALGRSHEVELRAVVEPFLSDPSLEVQVQAAYALGQLGDRQATAGLLPLLGHATAASARVAAAYALDQLGAEAGTRVLRDSLVDTAASNDQRLRSALLLCEQGNQQAVSQLNEWSRRGALPQAIEIGALACIAQTGDPAALAQLRTKLDDEAHPAQRILAAARLTKLRDLQGPAYLRRLVETPGPNQLLAARYLAGPEETKAVALLREVVRTSPTDSALRQLALEGLVQNGSQPDALLCAPLLARRDDDRLRQNAADAIVQLTALLPSVLAAQSTLWARVAIFDENALVRSAAALALSRSADQSDVERLAKLLRDRDEGVRTAAARALGRRREPKALLALQEAAIRGTPGVRAAAWQSLVELGREFGQRGGTLAVAELLQWARGLLPTADAERQTFIVTTLYNLGDVGQRARLQVLSQSLDPQVRRQLVELVDGDPEFPVTMLRDLVFAVRFAAGRKLAEKGDQRALPVLTEALAMEGPEGLTAYRLLRKLGAPVAPPARLAALLLSATVEERLLGVAVLGSLPEEQAWPLLARAAHDPEPAVRRAASAAAAELGEHGAAVLPILRSLAEDPSAVVREPAATYLASYLMKSHPLAVRTKAAAPEYPASLPPAPPVSVAVAPKADGGIVAPAAAGIVPADPAAQGKGAVPDPLLAEVAALLHDYNVAWEKKDSRRALKLLSKARLFCSRALSGRTPAPVLEGCSLRLYEISYLLGRVHQGQEQWPEAMTEFAKAQAAAAHLPKRDRLPYRAELAAALLQVRPLVVSVELRRQTKGRCQVSTEWIPPGRHALEVDGNRQIVNAAAGETFKIGSCP